MQTMADENLDWSKPTAAEIRETLLRSARRMRDQPLLVRGVDLVAAITGTIPDNWEPST